MKIMYNTTSVAYVQDTIHLAVKLKARLLKTSIILPLGNFVAGLHHLRITANIWERSTWVKEKDLNSIENLMQ